MQAAEKQHAANFSALSQTMMQLSQTMERGFGLIGNILASPSYQDTAAPTHSPAMYSNSTSHATHYAASHSLFNNTPNLALYGSTQVLKSQSHSQHALSVL